MQMTRLRLMGFKSFVEPTDLLIEPGLTGVVGPNGCGKSNLLEALRWVMGETSYKSMRASAMEDVIFSGTAGRPARNAAEVTIFMDNTARRAPAEFNNDDTLEITRRIEREAGSSYRINAREVRARDVRVLFEDAASGARSPALVRQGQIGDIVNARPDQRRRILEDAAGIAGLHSRRHDAELRLKNADANLVRINDTLGQIQSRIDGLKRQARQARRHAAISEQIRASHATVLYVKWRMAQADVAAQEDALGKLAAELAKHLSQEAALIARETEASAASDTARKAETERAAALTRLTLQRDALAQDLNRAHQRIAELTAELERLGADHDRENRAHAEAVARISELEAEARQLEASHDADERSSELTKACEAAQAKLTAADLTLQTITDQATAEAAALRLNETRLTDAEAELGRLRERAARTALELANLVDNAPDPTEREAAAAHEAACAAAVQTIEDERETRRAARQAAEDAADQSAASLQKAELDHARIAAERTALERLLTPETPADHRPVIDAITITTGYERALAAALRDDLSAALDPAAPAHWRTTSDTSVEAPAPNAWPPNAEPLAPLIDAPPQLARTLAAIALVSSLDEAINAQSDLSPGQCLVTPDGDLVRWDGFVAKATAETSHARRLAERNRLVRLKDQEHAAADALASVRAQTEQAIQNRDMVRAADAQAETRLQAARRALQEATAALSACDRAAEAHRSRHDSAQAAAEQAAQDVEARQAAIARLRQTAAALPRTDHGPAIAAARAASTTARNALAHARGEQAAHERERQLRLNRAAAVSADLERWRKRLSETSAQCAAIAQRRTAVTAALTEADARPQTIETQKSRLADEIAAAEQARNNAADALAEADTNVREAATALKSLRAEMAAARESKARSEAHLETARQRRQDLANEIQATFEVRPEGCPRLAGITDDSALPDLNAAETRLARLRAERDRLGGVNLQAGRDLEEAEAEYATLDRDREDVEAAVAKLRGAIQKLNREARRRLVDAFDSVNRHFSSLFETLFGGGEARLELIESDDPLQGGLEIIAKPPGKKPVTLSLLSGGEQTLTALSLIFAVFLTNPSPICVLDEVDAPLDDANVDRFCTLMERMARDTDTRFLVITHHPMTMARMNRLFGVTMAERGVSQLVSVDLETAERFRDAS